MTQVSHKRFYVMAMAASGKSTFTQAHDRYCGYQIVDFGEDLPQRSLTTRLMLYVARFMPWLRPMIAQRPDMVDRYRHSYFDKAFEFLHTQQQSTVLLGRRTRSNFKELDVHDSIHFAMVIIPEEKHRRNCAARKRSMRNPIPYFHHWTTDFEKLKKVRKSMREYAQQFNIPIYESIEEAIESMHREYGSEQVAHR